MAQDSPLFDRLMVRIKDNPLVALVLVLAFVATTLATFTDAIRRLGALLPEWGRVAVDGSYRSDALQDARTRREYRYAFDLKSDGDRVTGTGRRLMTLCEGKRAENICAGHGVVVPLLDGVRDKRTLSFSANWGELAGGAPWTYVKVKESFRGKVDDAGIRFVQQDDQNDPPVEFLAVKETP